jgi:CelD/BcsL family acetyltransferase involved in cellulose biosynthesis
LEIDSIRMNLAVLPKSDPIRADGTPSVLARTRVFDDLAAAEPLWRKLEEAGAFASPYQRFEWIAHWYRHVGRPNGATPMIVVGFDRDDEPQLILPLIREQRYRIRVAAFSGGSHSNLNMPIWTEAVAADLTPERLRAILDEIAAAHRIDLFALTGLIPTWRGAANPLAALPRQPAADDVYFGTIAQIRPWPPRLPSGLRKKERQLVKIEGFRYTVATTAAATERILTFFNAHKAARFATQGIHNVFQDPGVMAFIAQGCRDGLAQGRPVIELHALEAGGDVLAIIGGVCDQNRFSVMFTSITTSPYSRKSPGIVLMSHVISNCASRGLTSFDLGAGRAEFKAHFCSGAESRFDSHVAYSLRGSALAAVLRTSNTVKRALKTNATLMNAVAAVRRSVQP